MFKLVLALKEKRKLRIKEEKGSTIPNNRVGRSNSVNKLKLPTSIFLPLFPFAFQFVKQMDPKLLAPLETLFLELGQNGPNANAMMTEKVDEKEQELAGKVEFENAS